MIIVSKNKLNIKYTKYINIENILQFSIINYDIIKINL